MKFQWPMHPLLMLTVALCTLVTIVIVHLFWPEATPNEMRGVVFLAGVTIATFGLLIATVIALLYRHRLRGRFRSGRCLQCGYDLQSHKSGDKCPECGTVVLLKRRQASNSR